MKKLLLISTLLFGATCQATEMQLTVEIPAIDAAEYHRPYVAAWLENDSNKLDNHLLVWYQDGDRSDKDKGEEWLKDLRRWWRKGGRSEDMPIDGISGATKPVGKHKVNFSADHKAMKDLKDGNYTLFIEASRENGGREVLKIPFSLPLKTEQLLTAKGVTELGDISVILKP